MAKRVVIVGGGLAGLAAAEALSARGLAVTLLEARPRLGGRASSFEDKATRTQIDNCQHVSLGCCTNFRHFCDRSGLSAGFRIDRELTFIAGDGRVNRLAAGRWPAPLHLAPGFARLRFLTAHDKYAIARGLSSLAKAGPSSLETEPFDVWLARHGQTENAVNRFWNVVLVSALSESLDRISAAHARKVFVDAFLVSADGWNVQIPTVPLDELYGTKLTAHLESQGVTIRLSAGVRRLVATESGVSAAELRTGEIVTGDEFVIAVPHHLLPPLLPPQLADRPEIAAAEGLETAPISSVHLWFDRPVTDLPHAVLIDRLCQWVFNRSALNPVGRQVGDPCYYQVVISASRELDGTPSADTIAAVVEELGEIWPAAKEAKLLHSRLVTEHRAVFSVMPGSDRLRPAQQSVLANLQLAGDWTSTGWPATMEGAVRSGYLAAENILRRCGQPQRLVQADLPVSPLCRWFLGVTRTESG